MPRFCLPGAREAEVATAGTTPPCRKAAAVRGPLAAWAARCGLAALVLVSAAGPSRSTTAPQPAPAGRQAAALPQPLSPCALAGVCGERTLLDRLAVILWDEYRPKPPPKPKPPTPEK